MALNPKIWYPIAVGASVLNLVGVGFATGAVHTTIHAALALGFGLWAQRRRQRSAAGEQLQVEAGTAAEQLQAGFEALQADVTRLRQELSETQERVDFVERVLAQAE